MSIEYTKLCFRHVYLCMWLLLLSFSANSTDRGQLTYAELMMLVETEIGLVNNKYFVAAEDAGKARHKFAGKITIPDHAMYSEPSIIEPREILGKQTQLFPSVNLSFISHGGFLVPAERDILIPTNSDSFWQIQISPGHVWSEPRDKGMSRASFPFVLTSIIENETYNGVATFLYDDVSISALRYQIVQQSAPFMLQSNFVAAGQTKITYAPKAGNMTKLTKAFNKELQNRLIWKNWSELEARHGTELFENFNAGVDPTVIITSGLVIDNELYVQSIDTPYGPYPYPREMRTGVWSVTKTAAGMLTLLRIAQKYGDQILDYRIKDYLNVTAQHNGWKNVTFRHAMSMATGIGTGTLDVKPNNIGAGDASRPANNAGFDDYMTWYLAPTLEEKLDAVFKIPSYPWGPGEYARYRDRDIFTLSAALENLYKKKEGQSADLWEMMVDEVYRPIGIDHLSMTRTRESNKLGTPILAWGLYLSIDDIAKIGALIQNGGQHKGQQLISAAGLAEALYETDKRGLPTGTNNHFGSKSYYLSFWHEKFITKSKRTFYTPRMSGYGGNVIQLMPNGVIGFRFAKDLGDSGSALPIEPMVIIANQIRPFDHYDRAGRKLPAK